MSYGLGVDLGTTYTAAAVAVAGRLDPVRLGSQQPEMPSLVFLRPDGTVVVGEAAQRRGQHEPARLAREFKRRMGDPVPVMLGGSPFSAHALTARLLARVIETVVQHRGGAPERIVVTHPANWGPYKRELLAQAIHLADIGEVALRSEPEAAAVRYAGTERVAEGEIIAVYDLGGGTFDAAVLRKSADGFDVLGRPEGIEQLGGIDFDEAVLEHVRATLGDALDGLDPQDDETSAALARLRRECVEAKETLSYDTEAVVAVALPRLHTRVRITRSQFEAMITPALDDTVAAVRRALRSAGVRADQLRALVLTGGSARIPLVGEVLSTAFDRPVVLDETPELGIALGAAMLAGRPPAAPPTAASPGTAPPAPAPPAPASPGPAPLGSAPLASAPFASASPAPVVPAPSPQPALSRQPALSPQPAPSPQRAPEPQPRGPVIGRAAAPVTARRVDPVVPPAASDGGRRRRHHWALIGGVVAAALVVTAASAWPRGDPPPAASAPSASAAPAPAPVAALWRTGIGGPATGSPVADAERVFTGGEDGVIRAFRRSDGKPDWTFEASADEVFVARVLDGRVYAGTADGVLYAVDARTGDERWRRDIGERLLSRPSVYPRHIYVGDRTGVLHSYLRDKDRRWQHWTEAEIRTSPISVGDTAVVASRDGRLYAVNTRNRQIYAARVGQVTGTPVGVGEQVCAGLDDGSITCRSAEDGAVVSTIKANRPLSAPVGSGGIVYAAAADGTVAAWDAATGGQRWTVPPPDGISAPVRLVLREGMLYGTDARGRLFALDPADGAERWRFDLGDPVEEPPWVEGGALFAVGVTGTLHAVRVPRSPYATATPSAASPSTAPPRSPGP
jgi:outer membrane protein assembly factor BamB/actin-like ATPase involved in cell morphogenesis